MVHIIPDFSTKKAFKEAVKRGDKIKVNQPGFYPAPQNGKCVVEAPAKMHKWYATVELKNGYVVKVLQ